MKATSLVLLVAGLWGAGSWYHYTCNMKGFCGSGAEKAAVATAATGAAATAVTAASDTAEPTESTASTDKPADTEQTTDTTSATSTPTDSDNDGLPDELEARLGLDPHLSDSDGDGVSDIIEIGENTDAPLNTDGDSFINALDTDDDGDLDPTANEGADPNQDGDVADARDSNNDGTPDYLDPNSNNARLDNDGDGIANGVELTYGLNPNASDTDGDGVDDSKELEMGTKATSPDTDGDTVPDGVELAQSPLDTDGDGTIDALDNDDDNDGLMTADEQPDPNGDGNVADAMDADNNGVADYLQDNVIISGDDAGAETNTDVNAGESEGVTVKTTEAAEGTVSDDIQPARLYFPFRSANPELSGEAKAYFEKVVNYLKANEGASITLTGHTDNIGQAASNKALGMKRAEMIKGMLVDMGAPAERVSADSMGEKQPIADNGTDEGRQENRRVELVPVK